MQDKISPILGKIHNRTRYVWGPLIAIMLVMIFMVTILASVGLEEAQKQMPNAFHGKYLNYPNLWTMLEIFPVFSLAFVLIAGITTMLYSPHEQQKKPNVDDERQKEMSG